MKSTPRKFPDRIETKRLSLVAPRRGDGRMLNETVRASFPELHPWMPWAKRCPKAADTEKFCVEGAQAFKAKREFPFLIWLKADQALIGATGLVRGDWTVPKFEIGYWIRTDFTGLGYGSEAVTAVTRFARKYLRVRRLEIRTDMRNTRSAAVARRTGFKLEAVLRQDARDNRRRLRDTKIFVKLF